MEDFLNHVKGELKKNAVGVVFRAVNARFSAKYRHHDDSATGSNMAREEELEGEPSHHRFHVFPSKNRALPPPTLMQITPADEGSSSTTDLRLLESGPLRSSPPSVETPLPAESSPRTLDAGLPERPRRNRVLSLFRQHHGKNTSIDTTHTASSVSTR